MTGLEKILLEHFKYSMKDIDFDWNLLTDEEQLIFKNKETYNVIVRESNIQSKK